MLLLSSLAAMRSPEEAEDRRCEQEPDESPHDNLLHRWQDAECLPKEAAIQGVMQDVGVRQECDDIRGFFEPEAGAGLLVEVVDLLNVPALQGGYGRAASPDIGPVGFQVPGNLPSQ